MEKNKRKSLEVPNKNKEDQSWSNLIVGTPPMSAIRKIEQKKKSERTRNKIQVILK